MEWYLARMISRLLNMITQHVYDAYSACFNVYNLGFHKVSLLHEHSLCILLPLPHPTPLGNSMSARTDIMCSGGLYAPEVLGRCGVYVLWRYQRDALESHRDVNSVYVLWRYQRDALESHRDVNIVYDSMDTLMYTSDLFPEVIYECEHWFCVDDQRLQFAKFPVVVQYTYNAGVLRL